MSDISLKETPRLTQLSTGSGCGCKIAPAVLEEILGTEGVKETFAGLLVGTESKDDAAVYDLGNGNCLVSTTDFFTPIVDNPFDYGRIAAANSLSDVYAMGGKPILALAILGFPVDVLPVNSAKEIIAGAKSICKAAGIPLAGGHSINTKEPVFGLAVNGLVQQNNLKRNNTALEGDVLILTKPLGTGILAAAHKRGQIKEADLKIAVEVMTRLNSIGFELGKLKSVHAMTDVTGFGLLGHLLELCEGSNLSAEINYRDVPLIAGIQTYMDQMIFPDNTFRNWNSFEKKVNGITGPSFIPLCDPQTSGGLLIAVDADGVEKLKDIFNDNGEEKFFHVIGKLKRKLDSVVEVING